MTIPLPILPGVYRAAFKWTDSTTGQHAVNVMHFQSTTAGNQANDLYAALTALFTAGMWQTVVSSAWIANTDIIPLDGTSSTQSYTNAGTAGFKGSDASQPVPQVAVIAKFQTGNRGRANRGRAFLPLTGEGSCNAGSITGLLAGSMTTAWNTFNTAMAARSPISWDFCVASYDRKHSGASAHFHPIINVSVETFTATQRRRQPGRKVARH